jgi:hypothetical protein
MLDPSSSLGEVGIGVLRGDVGGVLGGAVLVFSMAYDGETNDGGDWVSMCRIVVAAVLALLLLRLRSLLELDNACKSLSVRNAISSNFSPTSFPSFFRHSMIASILAPGVFLK